MPKNFDPAIKERAVRMVLEQRPEYGSLSLDPPMLRGVRAGRDRRMLL